MIDFFLAVVILIFIIGFYISTWGSTIIAIQMKSDRTEMENIIFGISDLLIKSEGLPGDWNESNVIVIGLAKEDHVLDENKVSSFVTLPIDKTKKLLGIVNFNFFFRLKNIDGTILEDYGNYPIDAEEVIVSRRLVLYNNEIINMEFGLWK